MKPIVLTGIVLALGACAPADHTHPVTHSHPPPAPKAEAPHDHEHEGMIRRLIHEAHVEGHHGEQAVTDLFDKLHGWAHEDPKGPRGDEGVDGEKPAE